MFIFFSFLSWQILSKVGYFSKIVEMFRTALTAWSSKQQPKYKIIWVFILLGIYNFVSMLHCIQMSTLIYDISSCYFCCKEPYQDVSSPFDPCFGLLICALISENQGLEKLRSGSNLRKFSGPAHLDFFSVCHLGFFQVYGINLAFF